MSSVSRQSRDMFDSSDRSPTIPLTSSSISDSLEMASEDGLEWDDDTRLTERVQSLKKLEAINKVVKSLGSKNPSSPFWHLTKSAENGDVYMISMGGRLVSPITGRQFGPIEWVGHGRSKTELWFKFLGERSGVRKQRTDFNSKGDPFSLSLATCTNAKFIESVCSRSNVKQKKSRKQPFMVRRSASSSSSSSASEVTINLSSSASIIDIQPSQDEIQVIGKIHVDITRLNQPIYKHREISEVWVESLTDSLATTGPNTIIPTIPVMPALDYHGDPLDAPVFHLLGGNHLIKAVERLLESSGDHSHLRQVPCNVFCPKTLREGLAVANQHNRITATKLDLTFQDIVRQGRALLKNGEERQSVREILSLVSDKAKNSLSTVLSVSSLPDEDFNLIEKLFKQHEELETSRGKTPSSIKQQLFKSMQGLDANSKTAALRMAIDIGMTRTVERVNKEKKREAMKSEMVVKMKLNSWEEVQDQYQVEDTQLDSLLDYTNNKTRQFPPAFYEMIGSLEGRETRDIQDSEPDVIDITVRRNGVTVNDISEKMKLLENYIRNS